jgi:hypothetical protein
MAWLECGGGSDNKVQYIGVIRTQQSTTNILSDLFDLKIGDVIVCLGGGTGGGASLTVEGADILYNNMYSDFSCLVLRVTALTVTLFASNRAPTCYIFRKKSGTIQYNAILSDSTTYTALDKDHFLAICGQRYGGANPNAHTNADYIALFPFGSDYYSTEENSFSKILKTTENLTVTYGRGNGGNYIVEIY